MYFSQQSREKAHIFVHNSQKIRAFCPLAEKEGFEKSLHIVAIFVFYALYIVVKSV